jgi:hypothetical protein
LLLQVRALERVLVAALGVVEAECPAMFEKMLPKAKVAMTVSACCFLFAIIFV